MNIGEKLHQDHERIKELTDQIKSGQKRSQEKLLGELSKLLDVHMKAEERIFYERLMDIHATKFYALEGYEEHNLAKRVLGELQKLSPREDTWAPKFKVFNELLEHHIKEEEGEFYEAAKEHLDEDELEEMGEQFENEKNRKIARKISRRKAA